MDEIQREKKCSAERAREYLIEEMKASKKDVAAVARVTAGGQSLPMTAASKSAGDETGSKRVVSVSKFLFGSETVSGGCSLYLEVIAGEADLVFHYQVGLGRSRVRRRERAPTHQNHRAAGCC